jgi:hypothetical protein
MQVLRNYFYSYVYVKFFWCAIEHPTFSISDFLNLSTLIAKKYLIDFLRIITNQKTPHAFTQSAFVLFRPIQCYTPATALTAIPVGPGAGKNASRYRALQRQLAPVIKTIASTASRTADILESIAGTEAKHPRNERGVLEDREAQVEREVQAM